MSDLVSLAKTGGIARISLNRPDAGNTINLPLAQELLAVAIACDDDPAVRCVILQANGRLFCAGGDIGAMGAAGDQLSTLLAELIATLNAAVLRLSRMRKPLLNLVQGPATGAGMSLALLGDIVLAGRSSHFTPAYAGVGLTADGGLSWLLPRLIGLRRAQHVLLTNRRIGAEEAFATGLVTAVVDDEQLVAEGDLLAARLVDAPTGALGAARHLLQGSFETGLEAQLDAELRSMVVASRGEGREGIAAFLEKRKPDFQSV